MCGCALRSLGAPCVAQRVWAMPSVPAIGLSRQRLFQRAHLAHRAQAPQLAVGGQHRDAGRVVAAVFEALQTLDQDRHDIAPGDSLRLFRTCA